MCLKAVHFWSEGIEKVMECCEKVVVGHPMIEQKFQTLRLDVMRKQNELSLSDALRILFKCLNTFRETPELYSKISRVISKYASPWVYQFLSRYDEQDRRLLIDILFLLRLEPDTFCPRFQPEGVSNLAGRLILMILQVPNSDQEVIDSIIRSVGLIWERQLEMDEWTRKNLVNYFDTIIYGNKKLYTIGGREFESNSLLPFAGLLHYIPKQYIAACAKEIISYYQNDGGITILLDRFFVFLQWDSDNDMFAKDLVWRWMLHLFGALVCARQTVLIVYFANQRICGLIDLLFDENIAEGAMTVVEFLIYTYQHHHQLLQKAFKNLSSVCAHYLKNRSVNAPGDASYVHNRLCKRISEIGCVATHLIKVKQWPLTLPEELISIMKCFPEMSQEEINDKIVIHKWKTIANINKETINRVSLNSVIKEELTNSGPLEVHRSETGYVGLRNLINTCYANAAIQLLFTCDMFRVGLLTLGSSASHIIRTFQALLRMLQSDQEAVSNPRSFLEVSRPAHFFPYTQQDASEYLTFVLDKLEEADAPSSTSESTEHSRPFAGLVREMFEGKYEYTSACSQCGSNHHTSEVFKLLSLPLQGENSVDKLVESYFCDETKLLDWRCESCNTLGSGSQSIVINKLPRYLIISLKIFSYDRDTSQTKKITEEIPIVSSLRITESHYSFFGTILHHGTSLHSGHYTYFFRKDEQFIHFDDTKVLYTSIDSISSPHTTPYILIYKRV